MENKYKLLLVEDEVKLAQVIKDELQRVGYRIDIASDGNEASKLFSLHEYALAILDINLPAKSGLVLCKEFREVNKSMPIIMLTAVGEIHDKIQAFNIGADDYLVKPFHFDELFARVKALLKRSEPSTEDNKIVVEDLAIDFRNKTVERAGVSINLTAKEFTLLILLARNKERVISKQEILEKVWDLSFDTGTNTIEVYISFLRNKIDKPFSRKLIHTKPGFGYYIK
ncbi:MAG: response regulator transcription factor [Sediminibacterium sp.]|nr:MAG: two component transcriptional regulator winged helix [Chitinophagaceae bacterium]MDP1843323.1 response regulator transcription factor [Sediminibacterium sp.]TXT33145.1 MAG: two component transcriptional regulator winged helix family [Chitinophagaceae bacterium]